MRLICQCALAVAPDALSEVQAVISRLDPNKGETAYVDSAKGAKTPKDILDILAMPADKRNAGQKQKLLKWYAPRDEGWC